MQANKQIKVLIVSLFHSTIEWRLMKWVSEYFKQNKETRCERSINEGTM